MRSFRVSFGLSGILLLKFDESMLLMKTINRNVDDRTSVSKHETIFLLIRFKLHPQAPVFDEFINEITHTALRATAEVRKLPFQTIDDNNLTLWLRIGRNWERLNIRSALRTDHDLLTSKACQDWDHLIKGITTTPRSTIATTISRKRSHHIILGDLLNLNLGRHSANKNSESLLVWVILPLETQFIISNRSVAT